VLTVLLLALGGCSKSDEGGDEGPGPSPQPGAPVFYTAIGASDAIGIGSSVPCLPFAECPEGRGYVQLVAADLRRDGRRLTLRNLGVPGQVLSPRIEGIGDAHGRSIPGNFLEQQLPFVPGESTLVTVFAGGNDANAIGTAVSRGAGGGDPAAYIDAEVQAFGADYGALVTGVRSRAPAARVILLNLPNLATAPYMAARPRAERLLMQRIAVGFSRQTNALASQGAVIVDLMCNPRTYQSSYFSSDGFHPSDAGYAFMAEEVLRAVNDAGYPPPQADCAFMREVQ
jgi:lysophospholipase L1-like esterase